MKPNQYQKLAARTLLTKPPQMPTTTEYMVLWNLTGLSGEVGELVDYLKKAIFHKHGLSRDKVKEELGDILWYLSGLAYQHELTLEEVMEHNIEKLKTRYPDGFNTQDSINRRTHD